MPDVPKRKLSFGELQEHAWKAEHARKFEPMRSPTAKHGQVVRAPKNYAAKAEFGYGKVVQHLKDIMREG